jgi:hypothetical protein
MKTIMTQSTVIRLALCLASMAGIAANAQAGGIGDVLSQAAATVTNGSVDPTNSNNQLGWHITTGIVPPGSRPPSVSTFDDPTPPHMIHRVDLDGWVWTMAGNGPWYRTNIHAQHHVYNTGKAYWTYEGKNYPASPQYDDQALIAQIHNKIAADHQKQHEAAEKAKAIQQLVGIEQAILNAPQEQLDAVVQRLPLPEMFADRKQLVLVVQACDQDGINTAGFRRLGQALDRAIGQAQAQAQGQGNPGMPQAQPPGPQEFFAGNLGIFYVPVGLPDGTYGAKLTRRPDPGTPAGQIGLDVGDMIVQLDGQTITRPEDVLNHRDQTVVDVVRDNQRAQFNVLIP